MTYAAWIKVYKGMLEQPEALKKLIESRRPGIPETLKCIHKKIRVSEYHAGDFRKNLVTVIAEYEVYKRPRIVAAIGKNSYPARQRRSGKAILRQWRRAKPPRTRPAHTSL